MSLMSFEFWPAEKNGIVQRFALCCAGALIIGLALWAQHGFTHGLSVQLVYSFGITLSIWFLTDVVRLMAFYRRDAVVWPSNAIRWLFSSSAILLGYVLGTFIGDAYSGFSTFALMTYDINRFAQYLITSVIISVGFIGYFYFKERLATAQRQQSESRLKLLESQLEPHMLFNTLANLRALIQTDSVKAISMLDALNDYLRATLSGSRAAMHPLGDEFSRLKDYLALMQVRMGERLRYALDCPAHLSMHPIPPLLLQPLLENAIKHGLEPALTGGMVTVQAQQVGQNLLLTISNTGNSALALRASDLANSKGFGLAHVRERLSTTYGAQACLQVIHKEGFAASLQISLPLQTSL
jgi:signal transduction histidine kinase